MRAAWEGGRRRQYRRAVGLGSGKGGPDTDASRHHHDGGREPPQGGSQPAVPVIAHDGLVPGGQTIEGSKAGWPVILSSLKTYLERGIVLDITAPERDEATADWRSGM